MVKHLSCQCKFTKHVLVILDLLSPCIIVYSGLRAQALQGYSII